MYKCRNCLRTFEEPYVYYENHGFTSGPFEEWVVCPYCLETGWDDEDTVNKELELDQEEDE